MHYHSTYGWWLLNKMWARYFILLTCLSFETINSTHAFELSNDDVAFVARACDNGFNFTKLSQYDQFIVPYKLLIGNRLELDSIVKDKQTRKILNNCLDPKEQASILEFQMIITERRHPCKGQNIDQLLDYAKRYIIGKSPSIKNWFLKFVVHVGYTCKRSLLAHLAQADHEADDIDFIHALASPLAWPVLELEHAKKAMKFGGVSTSSNRQLVNRITASIPGLRRVEQLDIIDISLASSTPIATTGIEYEMSRRLKDYLSTIIEACQNLDQLYHSHVVSLAKLSHAGFLTGIDYGPIDDHQESSNSLHKWLSTASFCQSFARFSTEELETNDDRSQVKIRVKLDIHMREPRRHYVYESPLADDIMAQVSDNIWKVVPVDFVKRLKILLFGKGDGPILVQRQFDQYLKSLENDIENAYLRPEPSQENSD